MKTYSLDYSTMMESRSTTVATLLIITRLDGIIHRFTSHDQDIPRLGDTYVALGGYNWSAITSSTGSAVDELIIQTVIERAGVTDELIRIGVFDSAAFELQEVDWTNPDGYVDVLKEGTFGEISQEDASTDFELRGLSNLLRQQIGRRILKKCSFELGDQRCGVDLAPHTVSGSLTLVINRRFFNIDTPPALGLGRFTFTSGDNAGFTRDIRDLAPPFIRMHIDFPFTPQIGDTYTAHSGCRRTMDACQIDYNNGDRHGGFPDTPGNDKYFSTPNRR